MKTQDKTEDRNSDVIESSEKENPDILIKSSQVPESEVSFVANAANNSRCKESEILSKSQPVIILSSEEEKLETSSDSGSTSPIFRFRTIAITVTFGLSELKRSLYADLRYFDIYRQVTSMLYVLGFIKEMSNSNNISTW